MTTEDIDRRGIDRSTAYSRQLAQVHDTLREQLRDLTDNLADRPTHRGDLLTHCLAFCAGLTAHHQDEDDGLFGELLRAHPHLAPVVGNLVEDHQMIAALLQRVRDLADRATSGNDTTTEAMRRELAGLAAIMESHFSYEERSISAAIDADITDTGWSTRAFRHDQTTTRLKPPHPADLPHTG